MTDPDIAHIATEVGEKEDSFFGQLALVGLKVFRGRATNEDREYYKQLLKKWKDLVDEESTS